MKKEAMREGSHEEAEKNSKTNSPLASRLKLILTHPTPFLTSGLLFVG